MSILQAIYDTDFARTMRESLWAYPIALTVHSLGMGVLVGVLTVVDVRILGWFREKMPLWTIKPIITLAVLGFIVNLISGTMLFCADPVSYVHNPAFIVKIVGVFAGMIVLWLMVRTPEYRNIENMDVAAVGGLNLKVLAWTSLAIWTTAMIGGRLIGYLTE